MGFQIYDSQLRASSALLASVELLSNRERLIPNYKCGIHYHPVAVIVAPDSYVCVTVAPILALYKIPQLIYGSASVLNNKVQGAFIHQMFPDETHQYMGILYLLQYFNWTWIGVLYCDNENGERFVQNMLPILSKSGICFDYIQCFHKPDFLSEIENQMKEAIQRYQIAMDSSASVLVIHSDSHILPILRMMVEFLIGEDVPVKTKGKIWIFTTQMDFTEFNFQRFWDFSLLHGIISFAVHSNEVQGFQGFLQTRNPTTEKEGGFLRSFWENAFSCSFSHSPVYGKKTCTGEEKLESLPSSVLEMSMTSHSYSIYNAVFAVVYALQSIYSSQSKKRAIVKGENHEISNQLPLQFHHFLRYVSFNNSAGEWISFDQNGALIAGFDIINWLAFPNNSFMRVKVGTVDPIAPADNALTISKDDIMWPSSYNQVCPLSLCNDNCPSGFSKRKKEGEPFCCYDCIPCPEDMISNETDMDACFECPEGQYPNNGQHGCIPKYIVFLSYDEPLGVTLAILSLSFALLTALVLGIFIKYQDTAIVKANNRCLSYVLLTSLMLLFSGALLLMGQPHNLACFFRQCVLGFIFTVALSCVLAKAITVVLAFNATKPGSKMRKWMRKPLVNSIVFSCSYIQAIICVISLVTFPSFPDFDIHSMAKEIVLYCSEGPFFLHYSGYGMVGALAVLGFIVAFFARKLPDVFNEAKCITFSMLAFCSVWTSFIPIYMSTKGKYLVAVQVSFIVASSATLLICLFSPKIYIILLKPELNKKQSLWRTRT
ncbi:vomeronasal type-2 receptor 26-like [Sceloporus undulatus]|uniref:vomeronasal type-2 receptor 26-like n=1 Tax=Sceloporus undulatus TaxID=8520 RepID=UPI001C4A8232|nr:vomeronasal type-2 receptor 26-like [Sceloporus undulatus]